MTDKKRHPGGRPPLYKTPEELEAACNDYFDQTDTPNITSLCLYLGFCSYQGFTDQEKRSPEFSVIMKKAKLRVRSYLHERLMAEDNKTLGNLAFDLKCNHGWVDRQTLDVRSESKIRLIRDSLTPEQESRILAERQAQLEEKIDGSGGD